MLHLRAYLLKFLICIFMNINEQNHIYPLNLKKKFFRCQNCSQTSNFIIHTFSITKTSELFVLPGCQYIYIAILNLLPLNITFFDHFFIVFTRSFGLFIVRWIFKVNVAMDIIFLFSTTITKELFNVAWLAKIN